MHFNCLSYLPTYCNVNSLFFRNIALFVSRTRSAPTCTFGGLWRAAFSAANYCQECSMQSLYRRYRARTFVPHSQYANPLRTAKSALASFINTFVLSILIQSAASQTTSCAMTLSRMFVSSVSRRHQGFSVAFSRLS